VAEQWPLNVLPPGDKLDIKEGPQGLFIPGLRVEAVADADDVVAVLQKGKQHRSTFATNMNEHSSRSHLVLTIYVKGHDNAKGERATAWLHCSCATAEVTTASAVLLCHAVTS
jgi:kinesin family protein C2/C3